MQKARRHPLNGLRPLVSTRFQGLFHSLVQGSFHLSFTVLVHYRSLSSIQPWRMVPPYSDRISRVPPYSFNIFSGFVYRIVTLYDSSFQKYSTSIYNFKSSSYNPKIAETILVWANPRSLATTRGITIVFSSSGYLDVSVPRVCLLERISSLQTGWVAPFGNPRIKRLCAATRGLSQLITSFIASCIQGILHMPLFAFQKL